MRLPSTALIVLVGASGAGKSHWAAEWFRPEQVVSSDELRGIVGRHQQDIQASADAFEVLELIVERRLAGKLLTVIDSTALEAERRQRYLAMAARHGVACHAVVFDPPADEVKKRNRLRARSVPARVIAGQLAAVRRAREEMESEGFAAIHEGAGPVDIVPVEFMDGAGHRPVRLKFGLQVSSFTGAGGAASLAERLGEVAVIAEAAGFSSVWVMDHMVQIPQVGRPWEDLPESWTTLAWLAARTRRVRLGTLVTAVTMRNPAHLAKIVATVDVLSGGRATCGLGLAWWDWEHRLYGWPFPSVPERYTLLEDVLQLLPVMWGPGSPAFVGKVLSVGETVCYPRPVQDHIPILVGGSGPRRTLPLAARYADACNLFGDAGTVRRKVDILQSYCHEYGREPSEVEVTHLSTAVAAGSRRELTADVARLASGPDTPERAAERLGAGTVDDHIGRYQGLAEAGVQTAIVSLPDVWTPGALETFGQVIAALS